MICNVLAAADVSQIVLSVIGGVIIGGAVGVAIANVFRSGKSKEADIKAQSLLDDAKRVSETARKEAEVEVKKELLGLREDLDKEAKQQRKEMAEQQKRLTKREDVLDSKLAMLDKKEAAAEKREQSARSLQGQVEKRQRELDAEREKHLEELTRIGKLSTEEARREILKRTEENMRNELAELTDRAIERAKSDGEVKANAIIVDSIKRIAVDCVSESVVNSIAINSDELKGRIIGREGRNIRAFEKATGIDVIIDDTPGVVVISGFDPVRRAIASLSMQKLVADGRIHPTRIEDVVKKMTQEIEKDIDETGKRTIREMGIHNMSNKLVRLIGRLKYRTSYGQNCLQHSLEVAQFSSMIAEELKLDGKLALRAGLMHDIGKAIDHEHEGTHQGLGADLLRRSDEKPVVVNSAESHHDDVPPESLYAVIVQIADAISAARPGARRESLERYVKRLESLENIATAHEGVEKAYAIQAGREIRVIADSSKLDEVACSKLAMDIAKQVEDELNYPGEVKVTLIRENRFIEFAR